MATNPQIRIINLPQTSSIAATYTTEFIPVESALNNGRKMAVSDFLNSAGSNIFYTQVSTTNAATNAIATYGASGTTLQNNPNATIGPTGIITALGFQSSSTKKVKKNIKKLKNGLDIIKSLQGVTFNRKKTGENDIGLIAEDVHVVLPQAVGLDKNGEPISVDYSRIVPVLIEAIKALTNRVEELEKKLER